MTNEVAFRRFERVDPPPFLTTFSFDFASLTFFKKMFDYGNLWVRAPEYRLLWRPEQCVESPGTGGTGGSKCSTWVMGTKLYTT